MKLLTFYKKGVPALGVKTKAGIIDVAAALEVFPENGVFTDIMELINGGEEAVRRLQQFINSLDDKGAGFVKKEAEIEWGPAITKPSKILCVGLNYRKHADETKLPYPKVPILFNKFDNALTGHQSEIEVPRTTERLDHEVELGIVIGKTGKHIDEKDALDYVFGYCTTNDLSARDIQKSTSQWMVGKTNDGFAPVGPYLVTKDEIDNPNDLKLTTTVNGEVRQNSTTADMIFSCEHIISHISKFMTLKPGDLIMTGTPEGVIIGRPMKERVYLQPGDKVTVEVEKLGALTNTFIEDNE
ncbi:fumarylacetoacetate hydrolase family protein [Pseudogracilibacillus sp. SE30717A]|uniref:fumarylacetoacetate hydrolase family protein n=1 Tax=Pseudogracilibacillus sp. SE30717A TaxID=3098293 RepID=UPI00300E3A29